jgi:hypothetical protein
MKYILGQKIGMSQLFDKDGKIIFYYAFIDREWLIFAENIDVLKEIKRRIREKSLVQ